MESFLRLIVTIAGAALPTLLLGVALPGVEFDELAPAYTSVVALGLDGVLLAFVLVELAALMVPSWRALRQGLGRIALLRATFMVAAGLVVAQALAATWLLRSYGGYGVERGALAFILDALAMLGGTALLLVAARVVTRWGCGHGLSVVVVLGALPAWLVSADAATSGPDPETLVRSLVMVAAATLLVVGRKVRTERLPVVGLVPLLLPSWVVSALLLLFGVVGVNGLDGRWLWSLWTVSTLVVVGTAAWGWQRARREGWTGLVALAPAMALSMGVLLAIVAGDDALDLGNGVFAAGSGLAYFVIAVVVVMDVLREASLRWYVRLVPVLTFNDVDVATRVGERLAGENIAYVLRGVGHRTLLRFFGPWVPIRLLVDAERAQEAAALARAEANREAHEEISRFF